MRTIFCGTFGLVFLSFAHTALADPQDDALEAMAACRAIKADPVRLACMDAATQLLNETATNASPVAVTPTAPSAPTPSVTAPSVDAAAAPSPDPDIAAQAAAAERAALTREREALEAERAALATERAAIETAAENSRPSLLERLRPATGGDAEVEIVKIVRRRRDRKLLFHTNEGLVFEQALERINFQVPDALPIGATLSFEALGSKWIRFDNDPGRKHKVKIVD